MLRMQKKNSGISLIAATTSLVLVQSMFGVLLGACSDQSRDPAAETSPNSGITADVDTTAAGGHIPMEKGMFFKPDINAYGLHNEYDDDGDGDGINETHVRRYINSAGDTVFSMTTNDRLWAWSLDTSGDDDSDIKRNYVIRDSNCDGVFDERYGMSEEFHVPGCTKETAAPESPRSL